MRKMGLGERIIFKTTPGLPRVRESLMGRVRHQPRG